MKRRAIEAFALAVFVVTAVHLHATVEYDYKPGEFLVIKDGKSLDKKVAIVPLYRVRRKSANSACI